VLLRKQLIRLPLLLIFAAALSLPLLATNPPLPVIYYADVDLAVSGGIGSNDTSIFGGVHNAFVQANILIVGTNALVTGLIYTCDVDLLAADGVTVTGTRHFRVEADPAGGFDIVKANGLVGGSEFFLTPNATVFMKGGKSARTLPGANSFGYLGPPTQPGGFPAKITGFNADFVITTSNFTSDIGGPVTLDIGFATN
jgi:hypothetical protein